MGQSFDNLSYEGKVLCMRESLGLVESWLGRIRSGRVMPLDNNISSHWSFFNANYSSHIKKSH